MDGLLLTFDTNFDIKQTRWEFLAFRLDSGRRPVQDWIEELTVKAQNELESSMEFLSISPITFWKMPQFKILGDRYSGMGEIRFTSEGNRYRIYGYFGPKRMQFTLLHACMKQRSDLSAEMDIASHRKELVEANNRRAYAITF